MKIKADTIARTVVLIMALVNQTLAIFGKEALPFADNTVYELVTLLCTIGASAWAWWKNNSVTQKALEADEYLKKLKEEKNNDEM